MYDDVRASYWAADCLGEIIRFSRSKQVDKSMLKFRESIIRNIGNIFSVRTDRRADGQHSNINDEPCKFD